jgi:hypothetical protein
VGGRCGEIGPVSSFLSESLTRRDKQTREPMPILFTVICRFAGTALAEARHDHPFGILQTRRRRISSRIGSRRLEWEASLRRSPAVLKRIRIGWQFRRLSKRLTA